MNTLEGILLFFIMTMCSQSYPLSWTCDACLFLSAGMQQPMDSDTAAMGPRASRGSPSLGGDVHSCNYLDPLRQHLYDAFIEHIVRQGIFCATQCTTGVLVAAWHTPDSLRPEHDGSASGTARSP